MEKVGKSLSITFSIFLNFFLVLYLSIKLYMDIPEGGVDRSARVKPGGPGLLRRGDDVLLTRLFVENVPEVQRQPIR